MAKQRKFLYGAPLPEQPWDMKKPLTKKDVEKALERIKGLHLRLHLIACLIEDTREHGNFWSEDVIDKIYKLATSPLT